MRSVNAVTSERACEQRTVDRCARKWDREGKKNQGPAADSIGVEFGLRATRRGLVNHATRLAALGGEPHDCQIRS